MQAAEVSTPTDPVKGRPPTASGLVISNVSAAGKNPAQGDQLKATYVYADPDDDLEDPAKTVRNWLAGGQVISGATTDTFTPTAAQNKKFLSFAVTPESMLPADPNKAVAPIVSPDTGAPVLPPRAQLANEYTASATPLNWGDAYQHCAGLNARLPTAAELKALFVTYTRANAVGESSSGDIVNTYGWANQVHWANTGSDTQHDYVYLQDDGRQSSSGNETTYAFACAKFGTPELLPRVTGASIPAAAVGVGTPVTAAYTYNGNATIPDRSRFQWYTATASNGTTGKTAISGATAVSYTPVGADQGKWLVVEITPASYSNVVGTPVTAVATAIVTGSAPVATNVTVSGTYAAGQTLTASYHYSDADGELEGASTFKWFLGCNGDGYCTEAPGATSQTYTIKPGDMGGHISFGVTPKSSSGTPTNGNEARSTPVMAGKVEIRRFTTPEAGVYRDKWAAESYCQGLGNGARLPTVAELLSLFRTVTSGGTNTEMCSIYGWPLYKHCGGHTSGNAYDSYRASDTSSSGSNYMVVMTNGFNQPTGNTNTMQVSCIR